MIQVETHLEIIVHCGKTWEKRVFSCWILEEDFYPRATVSGGRAAPITSFPHRPQHNRTSRSEDLKMLLTHRIQETFIRVQLFALNASQFFSQHYAQTLKSRKLLEINIIFKLLI